MTHLGLHERDLQRHRRRIAGSAGLGASAVLRLCFLVALLLAYCGAVKEDRAQLKGDSQVQPGLPRRAQPNRSEGVPLPRHLRKLAQQPGGAVVMPADLASPAPVILAVAPDSPAGAVDPSTGAFVQAAAVNTTRCLRYAAGASSADGGDQRGPGVQTFAYIRPLLDLSGCEASRTVVMSASQEVTLQVRVNALVGSLPAGAVQATAGEVVRIQAPAIEGAFQVFNVTVRLATPSAPCNVSVPAGALSDAIGQASAASNTLVLVWDATPPQPTIRQAGKYRTTDERVIPLLLDFGERVRELNPVKLFNITGVGRVDVIYEVLRGRVFLFCNVSQADQPSVINVTVPPNITTDVAGNPNEGASLTLVYLPTSNASVALGKAVNYVFAASSGAFVVGALSANALNPMAVFPTGNDLGAMFGRVQATFLVGQLNLPTLPANYRTTADAFSWIQMNFPIPGGGGGDEEKDEEKKKRNGNRKGAGAVLLKSMVQGGIVFPREPSLVVVDPSGRTEVLSLPAEPASPQGSPAGSPTAAPALQPGPSPGGAPPGAPTGAAPPGSPATSQSPSPAAGGSTSPSGAPSPSPSPSPSPQLASSPSPASSPSLSPSISPSPSSPALSPSPGGSPSPSPSPGASPSPLPGESPLPTSSPSLSPSPVPSPAPSPSPSPSLEQSPSPAVLPEPSPSPVAVPSPSPTLGTFPSPSPDPLSPGPSPDFPLPSPAASPALPSPSPDPGPSAPLPGRPSAGPPLPQPSPQPMPPRAPRAQPAVPAQPPLRPPLPGAMPGLVRPPLPPPQQPALAQPAPVPPLAATPAAPTPLPGAPPLAPPPLAPPPPPTSATTPPSSPPPPSTLLPPPAFPPPPSTFPPPPLSILPPPVDLPPPSTVMQPPADLLPPPSLQPPALQLPPPSLFQPPPVDMPPPSSFPPPLVDLPPPSALPPPPSTLPPPPVDLPPPSTLPPPPGALPPPLSLLPPPQQLPPPSSFPPPPEQLPPPPVLPAPQPSPSPPPPSQSPPPPSLPPPTSPSPPPPSPPPPSPPPPSVCSGPEFSPCTGQCGVCSSGECLCVGGACTCVVSGPTSCASGQVYCGVCGLCTPSGNCNEQGPSGVGSYKERLCYASSPPACTQGRTCLTCGSSNIPGLVTCQGAGGPGGRRRLQEARGAGTAPALLAPSHQAQQAQHRQLTSAELGDLLHAAFWAQRGVTAAPAQQEQSSQPRRRPLQQAGAAAAPPVAGSPPPAAGAVLDGGQIYVVASTGTSDGASPNQTSALPPELLGVKLEGVIDELQLLFYQLGGASLRDLWNTLFWLTIGLAAVVALHAAIRSIVILMRWRMLMFFEWPRPEIWFIWCLLPIMAAQGAKCVLDDTPGGMAAGIWFGFLIPIGLVLLAAWLVAWHLLRGDPAHRSAFYTPTPKAVRRRRKRLGRATSSGSSGSQFDSALSSSTVDNSSKLWSVLSGKLASLERVNSGSVAGSEASVGSGDGPSDGAQGAALPHTPPRRRDPPSRSQSHNVAWQGAPQRAPRGPLFRSTSHGVAWPPSPAASQQQQGGPPQRSLSHNVRSPPAEQQPRGLLRSLSSDAWQAAQRAGSLLRSASSGARQPSMQRQRGMHARSLSSDAWRWTEGVEPAQRAQHEPGSPRVSDVPEERSVQLEDPLWQQWESQVAGQAAAAKAAANADAAAAAATAAQQQQQLRQPLPEKRRRLSLGRWLVRYILTPVFGYDATRHGEWVPSDGYQTSFVARYGVLFETARGPEMEWRPGTFEFDPATGRFDRGEMVPLATTRAARAREAVQTLGVTLQLAKMVAFAQLAAVFSVSHGHGGLWQLITLLVLILLYWAYVRLLAPLAAPSLAAEIISCACDLATFVCGIVVISLPAERYQDINRLGTAMLVFQVVGMLCHCLRYCLQQAVEKAGRLWRRWRPGPAERFAAVVHEVMARDPHILARKFADRWLLRVHGRGLSQRSLHAHERKRRVLPFALGSLSLPLSSSGSSKLRSSMSVRFSSLLPPLGRLGSAASADLPPGAPASEDGSGSGAGKRPPSRLPSLARR